MRLGAMIILALTLFLPASAGSGNPAPALPSIHEPSAPFSLDARLISLTGEGSTRRALIELTLFSREALTRVRLATRTGAGTDLEPIAIPAGHDGLRSLSAREILHVADLDAGRDHRLRFRAVGELPSGERVKATAFLRLNLDPRKSPRRSEDLIEYRARMEGR